MDMPERNMVNLTITMTREERKALKQLAILLHRLQATSYSIMSKVTVSYLSVLARSAVKVRIPNVHTKLLLQKSMM